MAGAMTELAQKFTSALPYARTLGMKIEDVLSGEARMSMPYDARLVGDPATGVIHGGVVSALMDTCAGTAVLSHPKGARSTATLSLRIDYMRPATPGQRLVAHAVCHHMTRSVAFVRVTTFDGDENRPVAMASGSFSVDFGTAAP